jgi:hypothetical protein
MMGALLIFVVFLVWLYCTHVSRSDPSWRAP